MRIERSFIISCLCAKFLLAKTTSFQLSYLLANLSKKLSTHQFHTDPLSSTNRFHTRTTPFQQKPLSSTPKSLSSTQKPLSSTPKTTQFHTKDHSVPHNPLFHTKNPSVQHTLKQKVFVWNWGVLGFRCWTEGFLVWNWGVCWTEGFLGLKWSGPFVWNWCFELRGCGTEGDPKKLHKIFTYSEI